MRHLLSPAFPGQAAERETLLIYAEVAAQPAETLELVAFSKKHCRIESLRQQGLAAEKLAQKYRARAALDTSRACCLTDYTPPEPDFAAWERLDALRREAEAYALRPGQICALTNYRD